VFELELVNENALDYQESLKKVDKCRDNNFDELVKLKEENESVKRLLNLKMFDRFRNYSDGSTQINVYEFIEKIEKMDFELDRLKQKERHFNNISNEYEILKRKIVLRQKTSKKIMKMAVVRTNST